MKKILPRTTLALLMALLMSIVFATQACAVNLGFMVEGNSVSFAPRLYGVPVENIAWGTSDASVGTVDTGRIDAHNPGRVIISATYRGATAYCGVVVLPKDVYVQVGQITSVPTAGLEKFYIEHSNIALVNQRGQILGVHEGNTRLGIAYGWQRQIVNVHVTSDYSAGGFSGSSGGTLDASGLPTGGSPSQLVHGNQLAGLRIGIDPGHQGRNNREQEEVSPLGGGTKDKVTSGGTGVKTRIEEHVTDLAIGLKLREALEALGAEVYMTRDTANVNISNKERAKMMNDLNVDLALRLHCNSSNNTNAKGMDVYTRASCAYSANDPARAEQLMMNEQRLAQAVFDEVPAITGGKRNSIHYTDNYTMNNWSTVSCLLVEMGFNSNPEEDVLLNDSDYQYKIVRGLVNAVCVYAGRDRVY